MRQNSRYDQDFSYAVDHFMKAENLNFPLYLQMEAVNLLEEMLNQFMTSVYTKINLKDLPIQLSLFLKI